MTPAFAAKLGVSIHPISICAQKIDSTALKTYDMAITGFSIQDKSGSTRFFEETFLLVDTTMEVVLGMSFLVLSNIDIQFDTKNFNWKSYSIAEALFTIRQVELIDKHNFAKVALDENSEMFALHIASFEVPETTEAADMAIHPDQANQMQVAALSQDKPLTEILPEHIDYADVFSHNLALELLENTGINKNAIKLIEETSSPLTALSIT